MSERASAPRPLATTSDGDGVFAFAWRMRGVLRVTVVVKVFRALSLEGKLTPIKAEPPVTSNRHHAQDNRRPVCEPSDVVPFREHVDIVVAAPAAERSFSRVAIARAGVVVFDKTVTSARIEGAGFSAAAISTPPFVGEVMELPEALDRRVFQCTPPDQRAAELRPSDQVLLQGLHAGVDRVVFSLPDRAPKVTAKLDQASHDVALRCDQLLIDVIAGRVVQVWRGSFSMPDEAALARVTVQATGAAPLGSVNIAGTVALDDAAPPPGAQPQWIAPAGGGKGGMSAALLRKMQGAPPAIAQSAPVKPATPGAGTAFIDPSSPASGTMMVEADAPVSLPFEKRPKQERPASQKGPPSGTPWAPTPVANTPIVPAAAVYATIAIDEDEPPPRASWVGEAPAPPPPSPPPPFEAPPAAPKPAGNPWRQDPAPAEEPKAPPAPPRVRTDLRAALRKKFNR